jgi:hypothetical protein
MELPDGMDWVDERTLKGAKVHLLKSLYGLKQSPHLWYQAINAFLLSLGFKQSSADPNLYIKDGVLLLLYVDNILIVSTSNDSPSSSANQVITALKTKYKMSNLGEARCFLGLEMNRDVNGISISQETYIDTMIQRFGMEDSHNVSNPRLTGSSLVTDGRVTQNFRKEKMTSNNSNDGNYLLLWGFSRS